MKTPILNKKTELEVNKLRNGALNYDPLHPEMWRECVNTSLDAIRTMRLVFVRLVSFYDL